MSFGFLVINICNHGEHYETPCLKAFHIGLSRIVEEEENVHLWPGWRAECNWYIAVCYLLVTCAITLRAIPLDVLGVGL
jgi:hypothetical protein